MVRKILLGIVCCVFAGSLSAAQKQLSLASPDGKLKATIDIGEKLTYNVIYDGKEVIAPSAISMTLDNGTVWGDNARLQKSTEKQIDTKIASPFYRADSVRDQCNELTLKFKGDYSVVFRAYNDGIAYRFVNHAKDPFCIVREEVDYRFPADAVATVPYVNRGNDGDFNSQFPNSFENVYKSEKLSELNQQRLMFLPLFVKTNDGVSVCLTETDLYDYPGLYLVADDGLRLAGVHAGYPKNVEGGGYNNLQLLVNEREDFIAKVEAPRNFPWRITVISENDKDIAASNLSYLLAEPSKLSDISWIKPGKVAWEWWNAWNLDGVDFETGVNNDTYKAYIDFASKNGIEYVILDEGWAVNMKADLMQVVDAIDIKELVDYAAERNVGIILWAGCYAFERNMDEVCKYYSDLGVKGFKVDFMDRDDQLMTEFNHRAAATAAKYKLILDLHGTHKPAGIHRTYPNVLNCEGVFGLEQVKWITADVDQVTYDVMIPFIRQVAGPLDYTQGAMRNASKGNYYPCYSEPMSQGTRCHQIAMYVVYDSPVNMMCDTPSNYEREQTCTDFIADVPTVWDETRILDGELGEYIVTARRKGDVWYVGGINNWTPREVEVDLSFLNDGSHQVELFKDGVNAHRAGRDYASESLAVDGKTKLKLRMAPGGGFAMRIE